MEINKMKFIVEKLINMKKTVSVMESCTGGGISNCITNISGASKIFKFGAVTYSNQHKIKFGVSKKILEKFSVYSPETAKEMSKKISNYSNSDYGVGITGKLGNADPQNDVGSNNTVFISIYDRSKNKFLEKQTEVNLRSRVANKEIIINTFINIFMDYVIAV